MMDSESLGQLVSIIKKQCDFSEDYNRVIIVNGLKISALVFLPLMKNEVEQVWLLAFG